MNRQYRKLVGLCQAIGILIGLLVAFIIVNLRVLSTVFKGGEGPGGSILAFGILLFSPVVGLLLGQLAAWVLFEKGPTQAQTEQVPLSRQKRPWMGTIVGALLGIPLGYVAAAAVAWNLLEFGYHKLAHSLGLLAFLSGPPIGAALGWSNAIQRQGKRDSKQKNSVMEVASAVIGWALIIVLGIVLLVLCLMYRSAVNNPV